MPRVPHKVQRALLRERVEREQKGVFADAVGGDYAKFEANFSRALTSNTTRGLYDSVVAASKRGSGDVGRSATAGVSVNEDLTATSPTPSGRPRKGFTVNLSTFATVSGGSTSTSPARSFATTLDGGGGGTPPRSASMSTPLRPGSTAQLQMVAPPPSASTRFGGGAETPCGSVVTSVPPPLPAKRFDWDTTGDPSLS